jgi:hypothetical protein
MLSTVLFKPYALSLPVDFSITNAAAGANRGSNSALGTKGGAQVGLVVLICFPAAKKQGFYRKDAKDAKKTGKSVSGSYLRTLRLKRAQRAGGKFQVLPVTSHGLY